MLRCPMCHAESLVHTRVAGDDPYRPCLSCSGLFLDPYPARQTNTVFEGSSGVARQQALEEARQEYFLRHLRRIEKQLGGAVNGRRLMEIGCGSGVLLRTAIARGWQADALELSSELAILAAQENPAANIVVGDVVDHTDGGGDYDAVMALDVLEHVMDPRLMLANCRAMLKPGGVLLLQTPNTAGLRSRMQGVAWEMRDADQHVNLFSPRGLRELLVKTRFEVVGWQTVSGSGMERGTARAIAAAKEWLLDRGTLGNALCVLGVSRGT